jgi:hypothetical protein
MTWAPHAGPRRNGRAATIALAVSLLGAAGCTGLEPAVIGAAVSGVQTGVTLFAGSQFWSYEYADFTNVVEAARVVAERLELEQVNENAEREGRYWAAYRYGPKNRLIEIEILRQTDVVTSIRVYVGAQSQRGMAALLLRQVFVDLRSRGAYPDEEVELRGQDGAVSVP